MGGTSRERRRSSRIARPSVDGVALAAYASSMSVSSRTCRPLSRSWPSVGDRGQERRGAISAVAGTAQQDDGQGRRSGSRSAQGSGGDPAAMNEDQVAHERYRRARRTGRRYQKREARTDRAGRRGLCTEKVTESDAQTLPTGTLSRTSCRTGSRQIQGTWRHAKVRRPTRCDGLSAGE